MDKEKTYITRDEDGKLICIWRKPDKGNWSPHKMPDCDSIIWQREDIEKVDFYCADDFKNKFKTNIRPSNKRCVHFPKKLLNNEDYKLFSDDPNRKK